jgi:plasmid stabilization system protein ParE
MNIAFDPRVEDDLAEAAAFYESRSAGLGDDFLAEFRRTLEAIVSGPARWQLVDGGPVRRSLLSRFPYAVYYHEAPERLLVLTVTHGRRPPEAWRLRLPSQR